MDEKNIKILVVDDEPGARKLLSGILGENHPVALADSTEEALTKIEKEKPQIVITDIRMPGKDGLYLLEEIKRLENDIIVILITGHSDKDMAIAAVQKGAFDFLEKPFSAKELRNSVQKAIEKLSLKQELFQLKHKSQELAKSAAIGMIASNLANEVFEPLLEFKQKFDDISASNLDAEKVENSLKELSKELSQITADLSKITGRFENKPEKIKSPDMTSEPATIDKICNDIKRLTLDRINTQDIYFTINLRTPENIMVENPVEITQTILKLIENSCDAVESLREKWVRIDFITRGDVIEISIVDSGSGIDEKIKDKIFEPYFSTSDSKTGLGLNIANDILSRLGGSINFDPTSNNTKFQLTIPKLEIQ